MRKWLKFVEADAPKRKTRIFYVGAAKTNEYLGAIEYYPGWRQYVFRGSMDETYWAADCLRELADKIEELNKERAAHRTVRTAPAPAQGPPCEHVWDWKVEIRHCSECDDLAEGPREKLPPGWSAAPAQCVQPNSPGPCIRERCHYWDDGCDWENTEEGRASAPASAQPREGGGR